MRLNEIAIEQIKTALEYHDTLNPKLWKSDDKLHPDVKEALKNISDNFIDSLKIDKNKIIDIIITGSNANYNWSKLSDIDLHVILDYKIICNDCTGFNIDDCFKALKTVWNDNHDITIKGHVVEVYAQPKEEKITGNAGVYSLKNTKWIKKPIKEKNLKYDRVHIKLKAQGLMDEINDLSEKDNETTIQRVKDKIKKMRKAGIERSGEFSLENLVFKVLRNSGYLEKLSNISKNKSDSDLSLK